MQKKSIAVFGSAFNPPHLGHLDVIHQALEFADEVIVVPSYRHAFGKEMAPFAKRVEMANALCEALDERAAVRVSGIEQQLSAKRGADSPVYTFDVLEALEEKYPSAMLTFVLGPDNAQPDVWNKFYRAQEIKDRWSVWAAKQNIAVRSTQVRDKLARGALVTENECPRSVIDLLRDVYPLNIRGQ